MTDLEVFLGGVIIVLLLVLVVVLFAVVYFRRRSQLYYSNWQTRQTGAYSLGSHKVMGDMSHVLGTFAMLGDYEQVILLSTTSTQSSMDLLGVKGDSLDFIELKKKGASLGTAERRIRRLVKEGKVRYIIKDVELPDNVQVTDRTKHGYWLGSVGMRLRKKKDEERTFVIPLGSGVKLDKSANKIENRIWARMREISGLTIEQVDALPEREFNELYEKAVESGTGRLHD